MTPEKIAIITITSIGVFILISCFIGLLVAGSLWGIPPFGKLMNKRLSKREGNGEKYNLENVPMLKDSPLQGYHIAYLGSSVTYGACSQQIAFPEYISKHNGTTFVKEAVSGTTLVEGKNSYVERLQKMNKSNSFDLFICQLSTNDATLKKPIGSVNTIDTTTVSGAINYIIDYVTQTWNCPIVFYTNCYYENEHYVHMVKTLKDIQAKKAIGIIDLYTDKNFNNITKEQRKLYMADDIHPTKAGYLEWWMPKMEQYLYDYIGD